MRLSLLVAQSLHGIKSCRTAGGIQTGQQAYYDREGNCTKHQPPGYKPNLFRWEMLAFQINVGAQIDDPPNSPAQCDSNEPAENTHHASFGEEQSFHVAVTGTDGFHNPDLAAALEDGHHQRIDDSNGGNGQGQAAEDSEEQIEHSEELPQAAGRVDDRKSIEAHLLDCVFDRLNLGRAFDVHLDGCICRCTVRHVGCVAQVGRLDHVQVLREFQWEEDARSGLAAHAVGIKIANADDHQSCFARDYRVACARGIVPPT